jgi:hypothetical protein
MKEYLQTFLKVTLAALSREDALGRMKELFPGFAQDDFLLVHSVNFQVNENPASSTRAS